MLAALAKARKYNPNKITGRHAFIEATVERLRQLGTKGDGDGRRFMHGVLRVAHSFWSTLTPDQRATWHQVALRDRAEARAAAAAEVTELVAKVAALGGPSHEDQISGDQLGRLRKCVFGARDIGVMLATFNDRRMTQSWVQGAGSEAISAPAAPPLVIQEQLGQFEVPSELFQREGPVADWARGIAHHQDNMFDADGLLFRGPDGFAAYAVLYAVQNPLSVVLAPMQYLPLRLPPVRAGFRFKDLDEAMRGVHRFTFALRGEFVSDGEVDHPGARVFVLRNLIIGVDDKVYCNCPLVLLEDFLPEWPPKEPKPTAGAGKGVGGGEWPDQQVPREVPVDERVLRGAREEAASRGWGRDRGRPRGVRPCVSSGPGRKGCDICCP